MKQKYKQKGDIQIVSINKIFNINIQIINYQRFINYKFYFRINPVTKKAEPYLPPHQKAMKIVWAYSFVIFMVKFFLLIGK